VIIEMCGGRLRSSVPLFWFPLLRACGSGIRSWGGASTGHWTRSHLALTIRWCLLGLGWTSTLRRRFCSRLSRKPNWGRSRFRLRFSILLISCI